MRLKLTLLALVAAITVACATDTTGLRTVADDPTFPADSAAAVAKGGLWPQSLVLRAQARQHQVTANDLNCTGPITHVSEIATPTDPTNGPEFMDERHVNGPHDYTTHGSDGHIHAQVIRGTFGNECVATDANAGIVWDPEVDYANYWTVVNQSLQDITIRAKAANNHWARWGARAIQNTQVYDTTWTLVWSTTVP